MLRWAVSFLMVALVAGVLAFSGVAAEAADIARLLFYLFLVLALLTLFFSVATGSRPSP